VTGELEALTVHVEVLTHMHQDFEKKMTEYAGEVKDAITRLTNIVAAHEERIERLEDQQ
jgi:hypothetical protein